MTNLEAAKASISYPVSDIYFEKSFIDNGINGDDKYTQPSKEFELSIANVLITLFNQPNITEGGFQISLSDKEMIKDQVNAIYSKHGLKIPFVSKNPTIKNQSQRW